ncbi:MAG: peptidylprolyl isomerase [Candidatus Hydrogenedentes bacterium]|nr:peptidylprolyl isomerase [Candidatus Hydrogenedentota bacterium]
MNIFTTVVLPATILMVGLVSATASADIVDSIWATVDKEAILQSEVLAMVGPTLNELRRTVSAEDFDRRVDTLVQQALDQAIEDKILLREAQLAGIEIEDAQVEQRLEDLKKMYPSNEEFIKELDSAGETITDLRARIKKQELARRMAVTKRNQFEKDVVVAETDVARYYQENQSEFNRPERVRCRQIFLNAGKEPDERARVRAQLEELKKELETGADFAQLAQAHSQAPGADQGGIIGWVARGDLVEPLEAAAFGTSEGAISDIVETESGFSLIRVERKEAAGLATLDEVRADIEPILRGKTAEERYNKWMGELRKRSHVQVYL